MASWLSVATRSAWVPPCAWPVFSSTVGVPYALQAATPGCSMSPSANSTGAPMQMRTEQQQAIARARGVRISRSSFGWEGEGRRNGRQAKP